MSTYILYTYQFAPLFNEGQKLFDNLPTVAERMEKKQDYLLQILSDKYFKFRRAGEGVFEHQKRHESNEIIILKLANNKQLGLEKNFEIRKHQYSPSCFVIIDNRKDIQRIAIEDNLTAFSSTDVVKNILEYSFKKALKPFGLTISIKKEYKSTEFWQLIEQYPQGVSMVRFHFSYPNLPRVGKSISDLIINQSKLTNSKETTFELKSSNTEQLSLSNENEQLNGLIDASAKSGNAITIKIKNYRKHRKTGETTKSIEIKDLEILIQNGDLFEDVSEKIVEILNSAK